MTNLETISKEIRTRKAGKTDKYDIVIECKRLEGQEPDALTGKATLIDPGEVASNAGRHSVDVTFFPKTGNLNVVSHYTPEDFDSTVIDALLGYMREPFE